MTPEDLAAELVEQGVTALRVQAGVATAQRVHCPTCGAKPGAACTRGRAARVFAKAPHSRRLLAGREVARHGCIGGGW